MDLSRVFQSKVVILLVVGVSALVISRILKRGRMAEERPSGLENLLWFGGMVVTLATLIFALSQGFSVDVPKDKQGARKLKNFEPEPSGCNKPAQRLKRFDKKQ